MRSQKTKALIDLQKILTTKMNLIVHVKQHGTEIEELYIDNDFKQGSSEKLDDGLPEEDKNDDTGIEFHMNRVSERYGITFTLDVATNDHWIVVKEE